MSPENNIQKNVLEKIHDGVVGMHSRWYFIFRTMLIGFGALFIFSISLFILSFIFFSVRESGVQFLLEFSERGLVTFVTLFPWLTLLFVIILFVILEGVLRVFSFSYRFSLLRTFLWIIIVGAIGSTLLGFTPLHSFLLSRADTGELPILGSWYEQIHDSHQDEGIYRGDVISISPSYFTISHNDTDRDSDEGTWSIIPPKDFNLQTLSVGDKIYAATNMYGGIIYAYGIRIIPKDE